MKGNVSKTRGVLGATGPIGPQGPQGEKGVQGEKGDTPSIILRLDDEGNLYYNSDGILLDKEYVESQNLVTKDEVGNLAHFVINLDSAFAGDKTFNEIVAAYNEGKEIIGVMPDMNITFRFTVITCVDAGIQLMGQKANSVLILMCTSDNVWSMDAIDLVSSDEMTNKIDSAINKAVSGIEKTANKTILITANSTSQQYPSAKAVYNLVNSTEYRLQTQLDAIQDTSSEILETIGDMETALDTKADKPIIERRPGPVSYCSFVFSDNYNKEIRLLALYNDPAEIEFYFDNGEYPEDYTSGVSFFSPDDPPELIYTTSTIINWVGTDCATVDGLSIFQPSPNTHYDIVFYYNGNQFIGLVHGYVPASGNVVSE